MAAFSTCANKGFKISFPNGLTLSTQFGGGNYSTNYDAEIGSKHDHEADTVEIAVFPTDSKLPGSSHWLTSKIASAAGFGDLGDEVMGYLPLEDWLRMFDATRNYRHG